MVVVLQGEVEEVVAVVVVGVVQQEDQVMVVGSVLELVWESTGEVEVVAVAEVVVAAVAPMVGMVMEVVSEWV